MQRREFVKYSVGSLILTPWLLNRHSIHYTDRYASRVVSITDKLAGSISYQAGSKLNSDNVIVDKIMSSGINNLRVARMVDMAVMKLTDQPTVGKAWESLFPPGHPNKNTRIGIKLNFSYGDWREDEENDWSKIFCPFGPKAAVSNAIVSGLTQMLEGTFPVENITFIERMYSVGTRQFFPLIQGYRPVAENREGLYFDRRTGAPGMHWIYASNPLELPEDAPSFVAAPDYSDPYRAPQRIYRAVYDNDFLINYAIAKDHREAGITGAMKNNYGCTDNPVGTHGSEWKRKDSPYPGTRLCVPSFYKNIHQHSPFLLNIMDALATLYNGGPLSGNVIQTDSIIVSRDPVALDKHLLNLVNSARQNNGMTIIDTEPGWTPDDHPNASFLPVAAGDDELGSLSLENLLHFDLSPEREVYNLPILEKSHSRVSEVKRTQNNYTIDLLLDASGRKHTIESSIQDNRGKVIRSFASQNTISSRITLEWDYRNENNVYVPDGIYVWNVVVDGALHTGTVNGFLHNR